MKIVDVEPIIKELYKIGNEKDESGEHEFALGIDTVIYLLEQAKAVDAEPVRYGKWEKIEEYYDLSTIRCSLCHEDWSFEVYDDIESLNYRYCPNCGAKMTAKEALEV